MLSLIRYIKWRRAAFRKPRIEDLADMLRYVRAAEYDLLTGRRRA